MIFSLTLPKSNSLESIKQPYKQQKIQLVDMPRFELVTTQIWSTKHWVSCRWNHHHMEYDECPALRRYGLYFYLLISNYGHNQLVIVTSYEGLRYNNPLLVRQNWLMCSILLVVGQVRIDWGTVVYWCSNKLEMTEVQWTISVRNKLELTEVQYCICARNKLKLLRYSTLLVLGTS